MVYVKLCFVMHTEECYSLLTFWVDKWNSGMSALRDDAKALRSQSNISILM